MTTANDLIRSVTNHPLAERHGIRQLKTGAKWLRDRYAMATWQQRVVPDLVLVGAQRSGTTALTDALFRLPMVDRPRRGKGSHYFSYNYWRGDKWFRSQFPTRAAAERVRSATGYRLVCLDACPYYLFHPFAVERLSQALPEAKILVMLRDPVRRAESHYHHSVANGHEDLDFAAALDAEAERLAGEVEKMAADVRYWSHAHEHHSYVSKGRYAEQLARLFDLFPRDQAAVISAEDFYASSDEVLARVTDFAGLPRARATERDDRNANEYQPMDPEIRLRLIECFRQPNEDLFGLLGTRFDWLG